MANKIVQLFVKNIAAVDKAANRRQFLVIKSAKEGAVKMSKEAMTFDEAMMGRKMHKVYMALSEHYGALMETLDSIRNSDDENKGAAIKGALTGYIGAMTKAVPGMMTEMEGDEGKSALDPASLITVRDQMDTIIKEMTMADVKDKKAPDASALTKMAHGIAAMFGRAAGATDETIAELEKAAKGEPEVVVPAEVTARMAKSETEAAELKKSNEELAKQVTALREDAELRKFAEEVAGYTSIGLDPTKDAALLKSVSEKLTPEHAGRIRELFKAAVAQAAASKLLGEIGSSAMGAAAESAAGQVQQKVAEVMQKNDKLSIEQARGAVFAADPALYERWRVETTVKV